jgi:hypothetical protein
VQRSSGAGMSRLQEQQYCHASVDKDTSVASPREARPTTEQEEEESIVHLSRR